MKNTIYNIVCALFGLGMIIFGTNIFMQFLPMPKMSPEQQELFAAFGKIGWLMPLVGLAEILGGILVLFPKTRALGALVIFPIILGILAHHVHHDPEGIGAGVVFAIVELWMLMENRKKYTPLF